jgi:hypothetical protein
MRLATALALCIAVLLQGGCGGASGGAGSGNGSQGDFAHMAGRLDDATVRVVQSLVPHAWLINGNICNTTGVQDEWTCLFETDDSMHEMNYRVVLQGSHYTATASPGGAANDAVGPGSWPARFSGSF